MESTATTTPTTANPTPSAIKLLKSWDVDGLLADLHACERAHTTWLTHHMVTKGTSVGRRLLLLRSRGGDLGDVDTGPNQLEPYQDTPLMEHAPYVREILAGLESTVGSALFTSLDPGGSIREHQDGPGFQLGTGYEIRFHIPVITSDDAWYVVGGQRHFPQPGEMWYGDFSLPHRFENRGTERRVYLMINTRVSHAVLRLFPDWYLAGRQVKIDPPPAAAPSWWRTIPGISFELDGVGGDLERAIARLPDGFQQVVRATFGERNEIRWVNDALWVVVRGRPTFKFEIENAGRLRVLHQPAAVELDVEGGVPVRGALELCIFGQIHHLPLRIGVLG